MIASILHLGKSGIPKKVSLRGGEEEGREGKKGKERRRGGRKRRRGGRKRRRRGKREEKETHFVVCLLALLPHATPHTLTAHHRG